VSFGAEGALIAGRAPDGDSSSRSLGAWTIPTVRDPGFGDRFDSMCAMLTSVMAPTKIDELMFFPQHMQPGDVATLDAYAEPMREFVLRLWAAHGVAEAMSSFISARVRSHDGFVGALAASHRELRQYSEAEQVEIATLAGLASLALS
jgi:hypothetical protein